MNPEKTYKCQTCEDFLPIDKFYKSPKGRASPHCIACNPGAVQLQRYKKAIRTQGTAAFAKKIEAAERNLSLMIQAQKEIQLTI